MPDYVVHGWPPLQTGTVLFCSVTVRTTNGGQSNQVFTHFYRLFDVHFTRIYGYLIPGVYLNYFKLTISFAVNQQMKGINSVNKLYSTAKEMILYRFILGDKSIIKFDEVLKIFCSG